MRAGETYRHRARDGLEGNRDGRKLRSPSGDGTVHGVEQQPCGVQVLDWVGLVLFKIKAIHSQWDHLR